jgi:hypothetical protein
MLRRSIKPELLDELPPHDPRARQSRRDLQRLNVWMGHDRIMRRLLGGVDRRHRAGPSRIVEFGAGDGTFLLRLAKGPLWRGATNEAVLVDRQDLVSTQTHESFTDVSWKALPIQSDVFEWVRKAELRPTDVVIANLFLHHFGKDALRTLFAHVAARAAGFVACEPRRSPWVLGMSRLVGLIGCNRVTRHDAAASVRAGFSGKELSALWPANGAWHLREERAGWFTHGFVAQRVAGASPAA